MMKNNKTLNKNIEKFLIDMFYRDTEEKSSIMSLGEHSISWLKKDFKDKTVRLRLKKTGIDYIGILKDLYIDRKGMKVVAKVEQNKEQPLVTIWIDKIYSNE